MEDLFRYKLLIQNDISFLELKLQTLKTNSKEEEETIIKIMSLNDLLSSLEIIKERSKKLYYFSKPLFDF